MSQKNPNPRIRCHVSNCAFNCGEEAYCSLQAIQVEPCGKQKSEARADASMCGSFRRD